MSTKALRLTKSRDDSLGIRFEKRDFDGEPPLVEEVFPGSLAAKAGIRPGDRIASVNGLSQVNALRTAQSLREADGTLEILLSPRSQSHSAAMQAGAAANARPVILGKPMASGLAEHIRLRKSEGEPIGLRFAEQEHAGPGSKLLVEKVFPGSIAARAGLCAGDQVLAINGTATCNAAAAARLLRAANGEIDLKLAPRARRGAAEVARARIEAEKAALYPTRDQAGAKSVAPQPAAQPPAPPPAAAEQPAEAVAENFVSGLMRRLSFSAPASRAAAHAKGDAGMADAVAQIEREQAATNPAAQPEPPKASKSFALGRERRPSYLESLFDFSGAQRKQDEEDRQKAAVRLQAATRRRAARNEYARVQRATVTMQAGARGRVARKEAKRVNDAASRCQAGWRGREARLQASKLRKRRGHKPAPYRAAATSKAPASKAPAIKAGGIGGLVRRMSWRADDASAGASTARGGRPDANSAAMAAAIAQVNNGATPRGGADAVTPRAGVGGLVRRLSFSRPRA
ncbi:hypothetical protein T492DRAFT_1141932 [Pavlovales sp. CCMP2436]|nr:hypothetical protein T492DRAFT_1141932 [Pavlovales sp. CCMP2436]|mmetsp:Transcript_44519/g.110311  ORF Transcript_44519/g.110311 Transcript_44519/m.110311 type:complete len:516 (-) Transcript_44519:284-1831(-)